MRQPEERNRRSGAAAARDLRTSASVSVALTVAFLPVFLLGALSGPIRSELGVTETGIGAAITVLFVTVGLTATAVGRLTERVGASTALRGGLLLSGLAAAAIGRFATSWWQLALGLGVVGVAIGMVDTGAARAFADRVTTGRQGTAFGIKEASVPSASLLAGLALPTLAVRFGWRAPFLTALLLAVIVAIVVPRRGDGRDDDRITEPAGGPAPPGRSRALVRFTVGVGLGAGAANAAATFLVPASTARGLSSSAAGTLLVVASVASIAARVGLGWWADRDRAVPIRVVAVMTGLGAVGAATLALPVPSGAAALGAIVLLGAGWGWAGLAFRAAVRARPEAPAVAAGTVLTGLGIGGALGPLGFGALTDALSYTAAWVATSAALLVASALAASAVPTDRDVVHRS